MAEEHVAHAAHGLKAQLTHKAGPLPVWAWAGIVAGVGILYLRKHKAGGATQQNPLLGTGAAGGPIAGGAGSGGYPAPGTSPTPVVAPPPTTLPAPAPLPVPGFATAPPVAGAAPAPYVQPALDLMQRGANVPDAIWNAITGAQAQLAQTYQFGGSQLAPKLDNVVYIDQAAQQALLSRSAPGVPSSNGGQTTYFRPSTPFGGAAALLSGGYGGAPSALPTSSSSGGGTYNLAMAQERWGPAITSISQLGPSQLATLQGAPGGYRA